MYLSALKSVIVFRRYCYLKETNYCNIQVESFDRNLEHILIRKLHHIDLDQFILLSYIFQSIPFLESNILKLKMIQINCRDTSVRLIKGKSRLKSYDKVGVIDTKVYEIELSGMQKAIS